jgi:hypothetical protein
LCAESIKRNLVRLPGRSSFHPPCMSTVAGS